MFCFLVVDDSHIARRMNGITIHKVLPDAQIIEAEGGYEAIEKVKEYSDIIDMIFMDVNMPDMNGLQTVEKIRQLNLTKAIPIIMVTTERGRDEILFAVQMGVKGYLIKPYTEEDFKMKLISNLDWNEKKLC
jgi:two-component system, chemotaxis family, chemotaxis protein CheY